MSTDGYNLVGLWFERQRFCVDYVGELVPECEYEVFRLTARWLDVYFSGEKPDFTPPIKLRGSEFQREIWGFLQRIPYGQTVTYKEIADMYREKRGIERMSAQAVGGAVGRNPVSVIVPCHRVVGSDGSLTGYAGGLRLKKYLLKLEKAVFRGRVLVV